jgi:hypothetical protein
LEGVLDPIQLLFAGVGFQLGSRHVQQRPHQVPFTQGTQGWHADEAPQPSTPQQAKQQGFCLIVTVLAGE